MLGRISLARSEQHREGRHRERRRQCDIAEQRDRGNRLILAQDGFKRGGDSLELKRDVGHRADDGDQRHGRGHRLALAVARGDEIGDRRDVLRLGELDDPAQERRAEADHQDRADIDRQKVDTGAGGKADRAEEGPGGAVDRQRQRIDQSTGAAALRRRQAVTVARDEKQEADVAEGGCDHAPVVQHRCLLPKVRREYSAIGCAKHGVYAASYRNGLLTLTSS